MTEMGKTFIHARMKEGTFPKQIQLGSRSVIWNEQEVIKWMEGQMAPDDRVQGHSLAFVDDRNVVVGIS